MLTIRKAKLSDLKTVVELFEEFMEDEHRNAVRQNPKARPYLIRKKNSTDIFRKWAIKNIKSKNNAILLPEVNGKAAGYILIFIKKDVPIYTVGRIGYISDLFVKKEFRRMKIGSRLMNESIKWFKKRGLKHISLNVYDGNKNARAFYEKHGMFYYHLEMRRKI
ncbi:MAG: GNAT family N-acetyltransferase [Candidatus Aenigmarchaeota archaeon]|nr:GNAT family N-acetyltransferase [Candidatus Aenigmarchaeota archaeon]